MGTTTYLDGTLYDQGDKAKSLEIDVGTTSYYGAGKQLYLTVEGRTVILDHASARELCDAFASVAAYLGYDR